MSNVATLKTFQESKSLAFACCFFKFNIETIIIQILDNANIKNIFPSILPAINKIINYKHEAATLAKAKTFAAIATGQPTPVAQAARPGVETKLPAKDNPHPHPNDAFNCEVSLLKYTFSSISNTSKYNS